MLDWENHRSTPVACVIRIRSSHQGRPMREDMTPLNGQVIELVALWFMGEQDPYPGEWALGSASGGQELAPANWIASGDVVPQQAKGADHA